MKNIYTPCHAAGGMSKYEWQRDPKRLGFILARYKFVAKMLTGKDVVLEVGCADGFGSRVVRREVNDLIAIDIDKQSIVQAIHSNKTEKINFVHSSLADWRRNMDNTTYGYDAVYALDVFEHIQPRQSDHFLFDLSEVAHVCIIGTPSLESQKYASKLSKLGHVNCVTGATLRKRCAQHWRQVFMFGMNDETLHTGFLPMSHYLFALCVK